MNQKYILAAPYNHHENRDKRRHLRHSVKGRRGRVASQMIVKFSIQHI